MRIGFPGLGGMGQPLDVPAIVNLLRKQASQA